MVRIQFQLTRRWSVILLLFPLIVILLGGGVVLTFSQPSRPPTNTLVWEMVGNPDSFDPAVDNTQFGNWMISNIYETLYTYPFNSSAVEPLVPLLAIEQPSISADGKNYSIELRQGITFHDGTPFNASCVKWNIERAMKIFSDSGVIFTLAEVLKGGAQVKEAALSNGTSSLIFRTTFDDWIANSGEIEVLDVYTVRFVLERPFSPFITLLASGATFVISPTFAYNHASTLELATWEAYGVDYGEYETYMNAHTCGTGPYSLINWIVDQYIEMDLYDNYWRATETVSELSPPSYAGAITKVFIRTNEDVTGRSLNLRAGIVDGVYWPTTHALDIWDPVAETSMDENIVVSTGGTSYTMMFFGFNMGTLNTTAGEAIRSPYANIDFRQCSSYAFDYDTFLSTAVNDFGRQAKGPIPYGMFGCNETSYTATYNISAAVEFWNAAMNDSLFVQTLEEMDYTITIYYNSGNTVREMGSLLLVEGLGLVVNDVAANTTGLGDLTFTTQPLESSNYLDFIRNRQMPIFFVGWTPDYADPDNYVYPFCYELGINAQIIGLNDSIINTNYLLAKAETNQTKRIEYYNIINDRAAELAPYLWVYQAIEFRTWRDWISGDGLTFNPMHDVYFYHINKTYSTDWGSGSYFIPMLGLPEIIFIVLLSYVMANVLLTPTLWRKRIKFTLLASYTGIILFLTALIVISFGLYPWGWNSLGTLWSSSVFAIFTVCMLWVPWSFLYYDYKQELERMKPPSPTIDLE